MALAFDAGLALFMYPAELLKYGATQTGAVDEAVTSEHFFVCLQADDREGWWTPLHPTRGQNRQLIMESAKSGFPDFVRSHSFYSTDELWRVPHKAAKKAAAMANDRSGVAQVNRVAKKGLPTMAAFAAATDVATPVS